MVSESADRTQSAAGNPLITRRRLIAYGVPALFMAIAFILYWYLGPQNTPAVNHVNQANAFVHGRLDIVPEDAKNINLIEKACDKIENGACTADSKLYVTHPPMPALLLLPGVLIFGLAINATLVSVVIGALTAPVVLGVVRN